jgi:dipeptidyl aminopeptidase/acylaminoacyl peptidase
MRLMGMVVVVALAPAGIGALWGWLVVHPSLFPRPVTETPGDWGVPYQDVTLKTADGLTLAAWYTPSTNGATILVAHGYGRARLVDMHALFARNGYGVLSWDFRAHGDSEGQLCTFGYQEIQDVEAALEYALAQPGVDWVGIWGGSLGGIAAIKTAVHRPEIRAIIVDGVSPALERTLQEGPVPALIRPFLRAVAEREMGIRVRQLRPVDEIGGINPRPVLIIHGTADSKIPDDSGQRLFDAAGEPRALWLVDGSDHLEARLDQPEVYERRVVAFLEAARAPSAD